MSETRFCSACGKTCVSWADWVGHNCMKYSRDTIARLTAENAALKDANKALEGRKMNKAEELIDKIISKAKEVAILGRSNDRNSWLEARQSLEDSRKQLLQLFSGREEK